MILCIVSVASKCFTDPIVWAVACLTLSWSALQVCTNKESVFSAVHICRNPPPRRRCEMWFESFSKELVKIFCWTTISFLLLLYILFSSLLLFPLTLDTLTLSLYGWGHLRTSCSALLIILKRAGHAHTHTHTYHTSCADCSALRSWRRVFIWLSECVCPLTGMLPLKSCCLHSVTTVCSLSLKHTHTLKHPPTHTHAHLCLLESRTRSGWLIRNGHRTVCPLKLLPPCRHTVLWLFDRSVVLLLAAAVVTLWAWAEAEDLFALPTISI